MRPGKLFLLFLLVVVCSADLHQLVRYFETLDSVNLQVATRKRRNADGILLKSKHISFQTLGRKFNMVLFPGSNAIGPNFRARTVDGDGKTETFDIDTNNFYTGFLEDDRTVEIDAHYEDGILFSSIYFPHETYVVEPAWRHRLTSTNATMITYRRSDVNWDEVFPIDPKTGNRTRMKEGIRLSQVNPAFTEGTNDSCCSKVKNGKSRHKRAVRLNTCHLITVADFMFFRDMGKEKRGTTAVFVISTMQSVNRYFKRTVWDSEKGFFDMGFKIEELIIHTKFTRFPPGHYNADKDWDYNERLIAFSELPQLQRFCLGHLLTSYPFKDNVLGLAFIASKDTATAGGICSMPFLTAGKFAIPRTGWSSAKNIRGQQVLSMQYQLVVTHELGHNWGAEHDPVTDECGPSSRNNGKYIMWPVSVTGYEENNKYFSPCSRRIVSSVLESKSHLCFKAATSVTSMCGNGIVEVKEECDPGVLEEGEKDACCTNLCHLRKSAKCSDFNHDCCKGCKTANASVKCAERNALACRDKSFCDGRTLSCPKSKKLPDWTSCIDMGACFNGECLDFCVVLGRQQNKTMTPCFCAQNATAMCRRCCAQVTGTVKGECLPTSEVLDAGRTCLAGTCDENGVCVRVQQKLNSRIFDFIHRLTVDRLWLFMRSNIVGTAILVTLIVWVPSSLIINYVDRRYERKREMKFKHAIQTHLHRTRGGTPQNVFLSPGSSFVSRQ